MKKHHTQYIAITNKGWWGRGVDIEGALKMANAFNKKGKLKKDIKVIAYINIQFEEDKLTQKQINALTKENGSTGNYQIGDFMPPWVDSFGSPRYYGILEKIFNEDFLSR